MILISIFFYLIFFTLSLLFYFLSLYFLQSEFEVFIEFNLVSLNSMYIEMVLYFDWYSLMFMSFVFYISSLIIKYSFEYMSEDKNFKRFILLLVFFVFSMMLMISSLNLISILLGWDGLGLTSYALVIYYQNVKSYNAGMITAMTNRIGDGAILVSIVLLMNYGSWNFLFVDIKDNLIKYLIILAAMTKSAQIPFSSWLPAAMAAPTPVSALVHSSTLVTAGVYLLFRFFETFNMGILQILLFISLMTMFMAGLAANFEFDLKKIIALSTLSQLGMMITILCLGEKSLAFFHLLIHALFKALLFMCAGAVIHNMGNTQDIRNMGGIGLCLPFTGICMNISNFALCGLPFLAGFYSKDLIIENLSMNFVSMFIYFIFFLSVGLTVSYTVRLSYYLFFGSLNFSNLNLLSDNNNKIMMKSMFGLVLFVILKGSILSWLTFKTPYFIILPFYMKMLTITVIILGSYWGYELMNMKFFFSNKSINLFSVVSFIGNMWNMPALSTLGMNFMILKVGKVYMKYIDHGWMEYYGSQKLFMLIQNSSQFIQGVSSIHLKSFLLLILLMYLFMYILVFYLNSLFSA
uniref:NADH-ubiquinone oxidoreductase chain 5 n=1 Tax=Curculionidae sp. BMNH 1274272 TaxID=1796500 RepID=A0A126TF06_9CUCU|nr:NADH dehydrogenase subunit 5 [Curculionidae sp. BMNH 1274272]